MRYLTILACLGLACLGLGACVDGSTGKPFYCTSKTCK